MTTETPKSWTVTVQVKEPESISEAVELRRSLLAVADIKRALGETDDEYVGPGGYDRSLLYDETNRLEELVTKMEVRTARDAMAALDLLLDLSETLHADKREESLISSVRQFIVGQMQTDRFKRS